MLAMVHSDKPWPMMCDDVILICLYRNTGSLQLREFGFANFSIQTTLLLSYGLRKGRNRVTGNVQVCIHTFNKDHISFL